MNKIIIGIFAILIVGSGGYYFYTTNEPESGVPSGEMNVNLKESSSGTPEGSTNTANQPASETSGQTTSENNGVKNMTLVEVSTHSSPESCYTAIRGGVYDVTAFILKHPGGDKAILNMCGKDGTSAFTKQHGGQDKPEAALANFKIADLIQ